MVKSCLKIFEILFYLQIDTFLFTFHLKRQLDDINKIVLNNMKVTSKNVSALKVVEALNHLNERQGACNRGRDGLPLRAGGKVQATTISQSAGAGTKAGSFGDVYQRASFVSRDV